MTVSEKIEAAIHSKEPIEIVYLGGSKPGAVRKIGPIGIAKGKVRARCYETGAVKQFLLDKIRLPDSNSDLEPNWNSAIFEKPNIESIDDLLGEAQDKLEGMGWHISHSPQHISLHRFFKNGNPMKGWDVLMDYEEMTYDEVYDFETDEMRKENFRKRVRPWSVRAKGKDTRSYKELATGYETFIEWAADLAPK